MMQRIEARSQCAHKEEVIMDPKAAAQEQIDAMQTDLIGLSHRIHAHPELGFEEERA
jgi:hypothetical protein